MTVVENGWYVRDTMILDGNVYDGCTFDHCELWFNGGEAPQFPNCTFVSCDWRLGEIPMNTVRFIASLRVNGISDLADLLVRAIQGLAVLPERPKN